VSGAILVVVDAGVMLLLLLVARHGMKRVPRIAEAPVG
jgi:hypothetical protein